MSTVFVRLFTLVHISAVALLCAASGQWSTAIADDTEVFFSTPASQGGSGSANVLLFLDNSDSMNEGVALSGTARRLEDGTIVVLDPVTGIETEVLGETRGIRLIDGTIRMLDTLTGVDVGLATFNGYGATILQPMRPLDSPALDASTYTGRVDRSRDDVSLDAELGRQGLFADFPRTVINTPLAPVYIRQRTGTANPHPVLPSVASISSRPVAVIETVVLKTDVASFDDSVSPSLVGSPNPIPLDVIETSNLTLPGSAGLSYAPLGTYFDGNRIIPVRTMLRVDTSDLAVGVRDRIRNGCVLQSYVEFQSAGTQADPELATKMLIQVFPNSTTAAIAPSILTIASAPPGIRNLPTVGRGSPTFVHRGIRHEMGSVSELSAPPLRWDAVPTSTTFRTPDLGRYIQTGIDNGVFDSAVDDQIDFNENFLITFSPRTVFDNDTYDDLSIYGLQPDFQTNPPPPRDVLAHNADDSLNPRLFITFSNEPCRAPNHNNNKFIMGAIFRDVRIPRGAAITDARLHLRPAGDYLSGDEFRMNVYIGSVSNPDTVSWSSAVPNMATLSRSDNVVWVDPGRQIPDLGALATSRTSQVQWTTFQDITSPDLSKLVQTVVDDPDWCGGNSIVVYIEPRKPGNQAQDKTSDPDIPELVGFAGTHNQLRSFHTFDSAPELAPKLEISFGDPADVVDACNVYEKTIPFQTVDVGMQDLTSGCSGLFGNREINSGFSDSFAPADRRLHFIHFRNIDLPDDVEILQSSMFLPNNRNTSATADPAVFPRKLNLYAHLPPTDADALSQSSPRGFVRSGTECLAKAVFDNQRSSTVVEWDLGTDSWNDPNDPVLGNLNRTYRQSPDLTPLFSQVVNNGTVWENTKQFTVIMHSDARVATGQGYREFSVSGLNRFNPVLNATMPYFRVRYQSNTFAGVNIRTHREQLINTVRNFTFTNTVTPHHAVLRESLAYFRNEEVFYGRRRAPGGDPSVPAPIILPSSLLNSRVSTVHSHDGSIIRPPECTSFLGTFDCADSRLSDGARYQTSESTQACETNHVIYITDGAPTGYSDDQKAAIQSFINANAPGLACDTDIPCLDINDPIIPTSNTALGVELRDNLIIESTDYNRLAKFMSSDDLYTAPNNPANQEPINLHTVSFDIGSAIGSRALAGEILRMMAVSGGGGYYSTGDAEGLTLALREILATATSTGVSLAAPSLTINAFNSLFTLDEIYVSMFVPDSNDIAWDGNVKKYKLRNTCPANNPSCTIGALLDADGDPVLDSDQNVDSGTRSLWSVTPDGDDVTAGGAASVMSRQANFPRLLFTDDGSSTVDATDLSLAPNYQVIAGNAASLAGDLNPRGTTTAENLIDWWRGTDIDDENGDGNITDKRWLIQDSLHTSIVPIIFGLDSTLDRPILKLFTATNAGEIRLINGETGEEEWRYIPRDQLGKASDLVEPGLVDLSDNPSSTRQYGIDGPMTSMVFDCNGDGNIQSDPSASGCTNTPEVTRDRVLLFAAQRRGGDAVYAFEAEPSASISDATSISDIKPRFLWTIDSQWRGFSHLAQTWSAPVPMRIYARDVLNGTPPASRLVVAFAGGYDTSNDSADDRNEPAAVSSDDQPGLRGRAIYMADMFTGECVLHIGPSPQSSDCDYSTVVPAMKYSIAMTPGFLNSGLQSNTPSKRGVDRFYFADLGGQVFRVDLNQAMATSTTRYASVKKIADLGQEADSADQPDNRRHFHTTPIVVPVRGDYTYSNQDPDYDLIILGSGSRPYPLSTGAQDRAYVLRDSDSTRIYATTDTVVPLTERDLVNTTRALPGVADLRSHSGFYIDLDDINDLNGEKIISLGAVLAGLWFFTTYEPGAPGFGASCMANEGLSRLYAVNILDAQPAIDQNGDGEIDIDDRSSIISTGIVSDIATAFLEGGTALLVNAEGGSRTLNTGGALSNLDTPIVQSRRQW